MTQKAKFVLGEICSPERKINLETLKNTIVLAIEIAREGREGRKVGTIFVVSDSKTVLTRSRCLILDPLKGYADHEKLITDSNVRETIKELAQLDGAFVISDSGVAVSACRYINATSTGLKMPLGLGSRHMAAASISLETNAVAVVVSESSVVRVFDDGVLISEILPELWLLSNYRMHLSGNIIQRTDSELAVLSRKEEQPDSEQVVTSKTASEEPTDR